MLLEYKPVRIIQKFSVVTSTVEKMQLLYPNAIVESRYPAISGYYKPGSVIDAPSKEEHGLFGSLPDHLVVYIPMVDGFDDPDSGVARSRKASHRGKQKWMRSMDGALIESPAKKVAAEPLPKPLPVAVPDFKQIEDKIKKSKSDDVKKTSRRKRKSKKHLVSDTGVNDDNLKTTKKDNEVIESDE